MLAAVMRVIVDQKLGEGLRERVRARIDPIPESLGSLVDQPEDVWAVMGTARNRIARGGDNQPSSAQLAALTVWRTPWPSALRLTSSGCQTPFCARP
jgi:hypothetical protein